jgi:Spy/CpxP family protein refolding chaperone
MTRKLITLIAAGAFTLGGLTYLQAEDPSGPPPGPQHEHGPGFKHDMENPFAHLSEKLDLTAEQKAKVQPIIDQTKPQLAAIHQEAMEKMRTLMESTAAQIRPLLTPEQQQKFDAMKKAHEDMHKAMQEMHAAETK